MIQDNHVPEEDPTLNHALNNPKESDSTDTEGVSSLEIRFQRWLQHFTFLTYPSLCIKYTFKDEYLTLLISCLFWFYDCFVFMELGIILSLNLVLNGWVKWIHQQPRPSWIQRLESNKSNMDSSLISPRQVVILRL